MRVNYRRDGRCCAAAAALALTLAGCASNSLAQGKADPASGGALEVVQVGKPAVKTLTLVTTQPARIEAIEQTPVHSKLAAYVDEVLADYGQVVKQGQPLAKLRAPELVAELALREALREQAVAEQTQAEASVTAAEAAATTAQARVTQAEAAGTRVRADVERWQLEFGRIEQLSAAGSINRQLVDETRQKLRAAEASLQEMAASISAAKAGLAEAVALAGKAKSDVLASQAKVRVAEANVAQSKAMLAYLTIESPFDGVVVSRGVDRGHFVQPATGNTAPLFVIARTDKIRVYIAVPETEAAYVNVGDPVVIEAPALRGAQFAGEVGRTSFGLSAGSRTLETIVDLDNREGLLRPGLFGTGKITLEERKGALVLPAAAVVRQGHEAFCYRLVGGKAAKTAIQLGIKVGDEFEVTGGVKEGDACILNKAASLKDGQAVQAAAVAAK